MKYKLKKILFTKRKENDKLARYFYQPISNFLLWIFLNLGMSANAVSWIMALISISGAVCYLTGTRSSLTAGSILFIIATILDHTDGDMARATKVFSKKGIFLDHIHHSTEELFTFVGMGIYLTNLSLNPIFFMMGLIASALLGIAMYFRATMFWFMKREGHYDQRYRKIPIVFLYGNFFKVWHVLVLLGAIFNFIYWVLVLALIWSIGTFIPKMYILYKDGELYDKEHNYSK